MSVGAESARSDGSVLPYWVPVGELLRVERRRADAVFAIPETRSWRALPSGGRLTREVWDRGSELRPGLRLWVKGQ